jgi:hypothetical protein
MRYLSQAGRAPKCRRGTSGRNADAPAAAAVDQSSQPSTSAAAGSQAGMPTRPAAETVAVGLRRLLSLPVDHGAAANPVRAAPPGPLDRGTHLGCRARRTALDHGAAANPVRAAPPEPFYSLRACSKAASERALIKIVAPCTFKLSLRECPVAKDKPRYKQHAAIFTKSVVIFGLSRPRCERRQPPRLIQSGSRARN